MCYPLLLCGLERAGPALPLSNRKLVDKGCRNNGAVVEGCGSGCAHPAYVIGVFLSKPDIDVVNICHRGLACDAIDVINHKFPSIVIDIDLLLKDTVVVIGLID